MLEIIDLHTGAKLSGCDSSALCLGNFDGVHLGHAELIRQTVELKDRLSKSGERILGGAWCFRQPPAELLFGEKHRCLTTTEEKLKIFAELGLDIAVLGDFPSLKCMSAEDFAKKILKEELGCRASVCGFNFRFGKGAQGTPELLFEILGKDSMVVDPVAVDGSTVSSSLIRKFLSDGDAESAAILLGRPYFITQTVVKGKMLGRKMGTPTVNQFFTDEKFVPRKGVYATTTEVFGKNYLSVTNVGTNPTVNDIGVRCETHILDFDGDLYGCKVKVCFHKFLRAEQKFNDISELTEAICRNIIETKEYFKNKL